MTSGAKVVTRPKWTSKPFAAVRAISPWSLLIVAFALCGAAYVGDYLWRPHDAADPIFGDFYAFWSFARFVHGPDPAGQVYDVVRLQAFQRALIDGFEGFYPCPYPPMFLLVLGPLGWFGYLPAYCLWIAVTLGLYLAAMAGRNWRSPAVWLAAVAPTTLFSIVFGQNGLLTAALMIGGFRMLARFPALGGAILGGLAFKPQLFVLVPVVLLAARQWRALAGLALSVLGAIAASSAAFGPDIWVRWMRATPMLWQLFEDNRPSLNHMLPTVTASLLGAGVSPGIANAVQAVVSLSVGVCLWLLFRRGGPVPRPLDTAALQVGVFLATPYAFVYDMPMVTSAVAVTMGCFIGSGRPWRQGEASVLLGALLLPVVMLSGAVDGWPVGPVTLGLLFALILRAGWGRQWGIIPVDATVERPCPPVVIPGTSPDVTGKMASVANSTTLF